MMSGLIASEDGMLYSRVGSVEFALSIGLIEGYSYKDEES